MTTSRVPNYRCDWSDYYFTCLCQMQSLTQPLPPLSHTYTKWVDRPRDAVCIMKILQYAANLSSLLTDTPTYSHLLTEGGNPAPTFHPLQQHGHAGERQEGTFRPQKGSAALLRWRAHTRRCPKLQCKSQDERGAETLPHSSVHISQNSSHSHIMVSLFEELCCKQRESQDFGWGPCLN